MIQYKVATTTHILSLDDINITSTLVRLDEAKDKKTYSIFRKIGGLNNLTDDNIKRVVVSSIMALEIGMFLSEEQKVEDVKDADRIVSAIYRQDDNFIVKLYKNDSIPEVEKQFAEEHKDIGKSEVVIISIGYIDKNANIDNVLSKEFEFIVKNIPSGNVIITEGVKSFKDFNSKIYEVSMNEK